MAVIYKIKEENKNPEDALIVQSGKEVEFTLGKIETDIAYLEKNKKEISSQLNVEKATIQNITRTHPHVAKMNQEDQTAAYLYRQATGYVNVAEEKLKAINLQLEDYAKDKAEILKQTGLKVKVKPVVVSKKKNA
jgi:hypothetical protein